VQMQQRTQVARDDERPQIVSRREAPGDGDRGGDGDPEEESARRARRRRYGDADRRNPLRLQSDSSPSAVTGQASPTPLEKSAAARPWQRRTARFLACRVGTRLAMYSAGRVGRGSHLNRIPPTISLHCGRFCPLIPPLQRPRALHFCPVANGLCAQKPAAWPSLRDSDAPR
jgi:hypothetical protein